MAGTISLLILEQQHRIQINNMSIVKKKKKKKAGRKVGRPTNYTADMPERVRAYIRRCAKTEIDQTKAKELPTICGFAVLIGTSTQTLDNWKAKHTEFLGALEELLDTQHDRLINRGLAGTYNPTIAKLLLSSNHGHAEQSNLKIEGKRTLAEMLEQSEGEDE